MMQLMILELNKLIKRRSAVAALLLVTVAAGILAWASISRAYTTDDSGKQISGPAAISLLKERGQDQTRVLDGHTLEAVVKHYQQIYRNPDHWIIPESGKGRVLSNEAYSRYLAKDEGIHQLLYGVFAPTDKYDRYFIDKLAPGVASTFYEARLARVSLYLNMDFSYGNYSASDKTYFLHMNERLDKPFTYGYAAGWEEISKSLKPMLLLTALGVVILLAPLFAAEYQTGAAAIILTTRHGRSKVIRAKLATAYIAATGFFAYGVLLYGLIVLASYGTAGGGNSLQTFALLSPYSLTLLTACLGSLALGYAGCLVIAAIVLALSAWMKSPFPVVIGGFLLLLVPLFIPHSKSSRLFNHLQALLPTNLMEGTIIFKQSEMYHFFGWSILQPPVMLVTAFVVASVLLPVAHRGFRTHQVK
jgi:hypothetical protein